MFELSCKNRNIFLIFVVPPTLKLVGKEESSQALFHLIFIFSKMNHYGSTAGDGLDFSRILQTPPPPRFTPVVLGSLLCGRAGNTHPAEAVGIYTDEGNASKTTH